MTNLKPCPFCGSPAKESFDEGRNQEWWIVCSNDDCDIFPTAACRVQEDARAWWNKRATAPEGGALEALKELVACKDLRDRIKEMDDPMNWKDPPGLEEMCEEYARRKPLAWDAARKVLSLMNNG